MARKSLSQSEVIHLVHRVFHADTQVALDQGVGRVVMNRLEILALDAEPGDGRHRAERLGHGAHHVFDKHRLGVGLLGQAFSSSRLSRAKTGALPQFSTHSISSSSQMCSGSGSRP